MNHHRSLSGYAATLLMLLALATLGAGCKKAPVEGRDIENDARALQQFNQGVEAYVTLHKRAEKDMPHIKATNSGHAIVKRQQSLAGRIQTARRQAKEGDVFTPEVSAYFRRQMDAAILVNRDGVEEALKAAAPGQQKITVNQPYPEDAPHVMMPPTILLHLPRLPELMQYDILGHDLILRDVECNLVVDVTRNVIP